ncbi:HpcH/HpaI aldolase/citrate lyase family protein [Pseudohoeflea coraliihabitans]|uniref:CoA ester lyase n=1 Tax=Pseudohoeflea coraliihabitans TaxID=2860393 RepID=A0ABS6WT82_9HYPH|nr:CoA ester lyase [Pseudohoeflea sp. DP4N28-3]MBW3099167.1 CoA ester lyase [Pseudohoeflea sp. DP4N28-3]
MTIAPHPDPESTRPIRARRSVLYVPAGHQRAMAKSRALESDAVIFDLEDSVAPTEKNAAREELRSFLAEPLAEGRETIVRINALSTPWGHEDLLAARAVRPDAILVPKVEEPEDISDIDAALDETDAPATLRLWAMIETPRGVMNAGHIARAARTPGCRLDCLVLGTNDLVKETNVAPTPGRPQLTAWLMQVLLAARAYGLDVLDGVFNDFRDAESFAAECRDGRAMGFDGKTLIHPSQIAVANDVFSVESDALREARAIVAAFAKPENAGVGVLSLDGRMVERLHAQSAAKLIEKARRESRTSGHKPDDEL